MKTLNDQILDFLSSNSIKMILITDENRWWYRNVYMYPACASIIQHPEMRFIGAYEEKVILIDQDLLEVLTEEELQFIVMHEAGHLMLNHMTSDKKMILNNELAADRFAAEFLELENSKIIFSSIGKCIKLVYQKKGIKSKWFLNKFTPWSLTVSPRFRKLNY